MVGATVNQQTLTTRRRESQNPQGRPNRGMDMWKAYLKADAWVLSKSQDGYLWLLDRTGVYVATIAFFEYAASCALSILGGSGTILFLCALAVIGLGLAKSP